MSQSVRIRTRNFVRQTFAASLGLGLLTLALTGSTASAVVLNSDPGFESQTTGAQVGLPWGPIGAGQTVETNSQSPFTNFLPAGTKGLHTPAGSGAYTVGAAGSTPANATGQLLFNVDFRNNTADASDYSLVVTADADGTRAAVAFTVTGTALYTNDSTSTPNGNTHGVNAATLTTGTWYNLQATLDVGANTYSAVLTPFGGSPLTVATNRSFYANDIINNIYTDSGSFQSVGGADPDHDIDNFALATVPEPATFGLLALGGLGILARRRRA